MRTGKTPRGKISNSESTPNGEVSTKGILPKKPAAGHPSTGQSGLVRKRDRHRPGARGPTIDIVLASTSPFLGFNRRPAAPARTSWRCTRHAASSGGRTIVEWSPTRRPSRTAAEQIVRLHDGRVRHHAMWTVGVGIPIPITVEHPDPHFRGGTATMFVNNLRTAFEAIIAQPAALERSPHARHHRCGVFSVTTSAVSLGDVATASITAELVAGRGSAR